MVQRNGGGRGQTDGHDVQLFDDAESLAETVAAYLFEGWREGDSLLVVVRPQHWAAISGQLAVLGAPVDEAVRSGRVSVLNAKGVLTGFMRNGRLVPDRFEDHVGDVVRSMIEVFGRPLRVYGEMVDLLAAEGDFVSAVDLERMWNRLRLVYPLKLFCGYSSAHFGAESSAAALKTICAEHDHASAKPSDLLGSWLLSDRRREPRARLH